MMKLTTQFNRRKLIQTSLLGAAAIPAARFIVSAPALAEDGELPHVPADNATAKALGYVDDTTSVDAAANPNHTAEQKCANCMLVQADSGEWRPCAIFPGLSVNENGWCKSWAKKA